MATLSRRDVEHVAHLARLGLSADEIDRLEGELNHILEQYAVLSELDTGAIAPTAQVIELENVMRADEVRPGFDPEIALANAPERHGDHFVVPAILGGADDEGGIRAHAATRAHVGTPIADAAPRAKDDPAAGPGPRTAEHPPAAEDP